MYHKQAFQVWTPARAWAWTRFAKAAQFQNEAAFAPSEENRAYAGRLIATDLPFDLQAYDYANTIVIIDLPAVESISYGLKLYQQTGLQPIPMFNAVTGTHTGGRHDVVATGDITAALAAGTYVLATGTAAESPFASFLFDYNRDNSLEYGADVYDNRWNVTPNDLPDAAYLTDSGVKKVLYLTNGTPHNDIAEILSAYQRSGINVQVYQSLPSAGGGVTGQFSDWTWENLELKELGSVPKPDAPTPGMLVARAHPNRKLLLWLFGILAAISGINAISQWFALEPLFWTVPGAQWLVYDIVPEAIGDVFLILFTAFNIIVWFAILLGSDKAIRIAWYAFIVDAVWFFSYALTYVAPAEAWNAGARGPMAFAETPAYALFAFGLPILFGLLIFFSYRKYRPFIGSPTPPGWYAGNKGNPEHRYWNGITWDDRLRYQQEDEGATSFVYYTMATRPVRRYGYSGYGGTGRGGYGGGAYGHSAHGG